MSLSSAQENGYESFFHGHVVDMLQFPMFTWVWPDWIPYFGGNEFTFLNQYLISLILQSQLEWELCFSLIKNLFRKLINFVWGNTIV